MKSQPCPDGTKLQVTVSATEGAMIKNLSCLSDHKVSVIAARAISAWLQQNYRDQIDLYHAHTINKETK